MFFKKSRLWKSEKRQRSGPLEKKFFFVSDFDETQNLKSLWPRDFTHEIWAESETKIFFLIFSRKIQRGVPSMSKNFLSLILLKYHVSNPYAIRISNFEFHQNLRQKNLWHRRVPFWIFRNLNFSFWKTRFLKKSL